MYAKVKKICDENPKKATCWEYALVAVLSSIIGGGAMMYLASIVAKAISQDSGPVPAIFGGSFAVLMVQLYEVMRRRDLKKLDLDDATKKDLEFTASVGNSAACAFVLLVFILIAIF